MKNILSVIGLFLPVPFYTTGVDKNGALTNKKLSWQFTLTIGNVPLGWIIVVIDLIIHFILK